MILTKFLHKDNTILFCTEDNQTYRPGDIVLHKKQNYLIISVATFDVKETQSLEQHVTVVLDDED